jgi:hypothetical protein
VVVHALHRAQGEEVYRGLRRHAGDGEGDRAADRAEEQAFDGVVVLRAEGVGHHEAVVPRVDVPVQEPVQVHVPVPGVLPPVQHHHANQELPRQRQVPVGDQPAACFSEAMADAAGELLSPVTCVCRRQIKVIVNGVII